MKATIYLSIVKKTVSSLVVMAMSVAAFGQANSSFLNNSPLIHSYSHGALANRNQFNNNVGASGVIRTQLSWQNAADLDLRFLLPQGVGSYVGSGFETFPIKNTLFLDTPDRHVWAGQKTVVFSNGQAQSSLDVDVRDGIANAPGGYRIENNYLSGNIPSGTYSFAVENYDNSHYYRNNPSAPATNFNFAVTLSGNGYIIPDNTLPLIAETGYAFGATGSIKDVGAIPTSASPIYSFNFFNPGLDSTHASGIDFFKRFNGNFLPGTYLAMLNVPGMNPAQAPSMVDAMHRMMNGQKNQFDSLSVLTNMGEGRLQKEFAKHFATPDSKHNTAQYIDPKTGQAVTVARSDFIRAMWAINENKALKQQGDAFMASLPEQTRRDFQAIQNQHGNQHSFTELRTADNNFLTNGQVANSVNSTVLRALHSQDAQIAKGIFNDMVAGRTTTNAGAFFDRNQVMGYDGALQNVAYIRNHHGQVLQVTEGQLGKVSDLAVEQIRINRINAQIIEQNRVALEKQKTQIALSSQSNVSNPNNAVYNPYEICYADGSHLTTISAQTGMSTPILFTNKYADNTQTFLNNVSLVSITGYGEIPATIADVGNLGIGLTRATYNSLKSSSYAAGSLYYHINGESEKSISLSNTAEQIYNISVDQYKNTSASALGIITPLSSGGYYNLLFRTENGVSNIAKNEKLIEWFEKNKNTADVYLRTSIGKDAADYVGISVDTAKRYQASLGYELEKITETSSKLLRNQARAIEQAVIKNNPQFENVINSISEKREIYDDAVEWGESWLKKHGYDSLIK